jgi:quinol monooxygenase YgiN
MQKVEGSSPFIRSKKPAGNGGFLLSRTWLSRPETSLAVTRKVTRPANLGSVSGVGWMAQRRLQTEEKTMVLATAKIEDFDRFWNTFSTKGAEKRKQHGCKGAHVFRDPNESDRVWAIFDWDEAGWQSFTSDPEVPAIFQEAGFTQGPPKSAEFLRQHDA